MNYIHRNGGWRGDEPTWDTCADVRETGGYDEDIREAGIADMDEFARRMQTSIVESMDGGDEHGEENVDRPWRDLE